MVPQERLEGGAAGVGHEERQRHRGGIGGHVDGQLVHEVAGGVGLGMVPAGAVRALRQVPHRYAESVVNTATLSSSVAYNPRSVR